MAYNYSRNNGRNSYGFSSGSSGGWAGNLRSLVVTLIILALAIKVWKVFFKTGEPDEDEKLTPSESANLDAIADLPVNNSDTTIGDTEAKTLADKYFEELDSTFYISVATLGDILAPLTGNDIRKVYKAFGIRKYTGGLWSWETSYLNMVEYTKEKLTSSEWETMLPFFERANLA